MKDQYGRIIDYMRISITDRCNLRCRYCMPDGIECTAHEEILTYEEIMRICKAALALGITNFKITGGEPLVRRGAIPFMESLKATPGVKTVTLTTNGIMLSGKAKQLKEIGIDAINISLDTTDAKKYEEITGSDALAVVEQNIKDCYEEGIKTKINGVLLKDCEESVAQLATFARDYNIDVRYIELMPIGFGKLGGGLEPERARQLLTNLYPDLTEVKKNENYIGNGPARYEQSKLLKGKIGWIDAVSHTFCEQCNRIRLTSTGMLKPCLCYSTGTDIKKAMRDGCTDEQLQNLIYETIYYKPQAHCFKEQDEISESRQMVEIGG